jgi:glycosyltransferase involved in cell wall biosynthesis
MISVIIPSYNCSQTICTTLESLFAQHYKNLEVIVVDDGSNDDTKEVLRPYQGKIHYIFQENRGIASARNAGINASKGKYIAFLDADDLCAKNRFSLQMQCFELFPEIGMVFSDFEMFSDRGTIYNSGIKKYFGVFDLYRIDFQDIFREVHTINSGERVYKGKILDTMFLSNLALPSTVLLKKEISSKVGILNEIYKHNTDYDFFLRISEQYEICYIDMPLLRYRVWEGNISLTQKAARNEQEILDIIEDFLQNNELFFRENPKLVKKRISQLQYSLGYAHFSEGNLKEARTSLLKSIGNGYFSWEKYFFYFLSFFPLDVLITLKRIKRAFTKDR